MHIDDLSLDKLLDLNEQICLRIDYRLKVIHSNNLKVIHYSLGLSINPACFFSLIR